MARTSPNHGLYVNGARFNNGRQCHSANGSQARSDLLVWNTCLGPSTGSPPHLHTIHNGPLTSASGGHENVLSRLARL